MHVGLSASCLGELVHHNPELAVQILISMVSHPQYSEYLEALLEMGTSSHQLEVFSKISKVELLPQEYIHLFYIRVMEFCMNMEAKEREKVNMVRIICVFFMNQLKSKICVMNPPLLLMIQKFCLEFSRVPAANNLQRLLATETYMNS
jgi:hypothetical protein